MSYCHQCNSVGISEKTERNRQASAIIVVIYMNEMQDREQLKPVTLFQWIWIHYGFIGGLIDLHPAKIWEIQTNRVYSEVTICPKHLPQALLFFRVINVIKY